MKSNRPTNRLVIELPGANRLVSALVALGVPESQAELCDASLRDALLLPFVPTPRLVAVPIPMAPPRRLQHRR
jgi:hypothetical protein